MNTSKTKGTKQAKAKADKTRKEQKKANTIKGMPFFCSSECVLTINKVTRVIDPKNFDNILAIESGIGDSWHKFVGKKGAMISMESFGLSGTGRDVMHHFGFSVSNIKKNVNKLIKKNR